MIRIVQNHFISIIHFVLLVVVIVAQFHGLLKYVFLTTNQYFHMQVLPQQVQYPSSYLCVRGFVCFIFEIYYTYSLPSRTARRTQRNITHAMQHSTAHAQTHTQNTYSNNLSNNTIQKKNPLPVHMSAQKINAFRFESAYIFKLRSSYLKHTISYNKHMVIVQ